MPHLHHEALEGSQVVLTLILVFTALLYLRGWRSLRFSPAKRSSVWRAVSFLIGLFLIWAAVSSPLSALDHELLTAHMLQHLLLMTLAPPLIWLGAPGDPMLHGLPQRFVEVVPAALWKSPAGKSFVKLLARPRVDWLAACAALIGWHIPKLFALGMHSVPWHVFEQVTFLVTGLMFWWPVIRPLAGDSRQDLSIILYLFFATLPCDILSGFLVFSDRVVYPMYFSSSHLLGFFPLVDQQCAAALMWTLVTVVYFVAGAILTIRLLEPEDFSHVELAQADSRGAGIAYTVSKSLEAL